MTFDFLHLFAGGFAGTVAAIITCPLEVVKTRQQSSVAKFNTTTLYSTTTSLTRFTKYSPTFLLCIVHIYKTEGWRSWFRGLVPNLVGVAPSSPPITLL
ncbi:solute carrier family 25 member 36-like isoform X1 [Dinothrombium tinctorium]|uniref:Solute carrier family 25 member 36-like isoform X1 n=1 Tax=Dinothrombium tinctorium TaxID=1965070 RepID=A0A3S3R1A6_9ACAR|nr:solute carrier family 25 member 36-like isoform X1 [Dinothrombium tinctorium]RWS16990.1 solute carrier family 25 member 36-like isoform X1 [Dinothrombium tinctorium]